MQCRCRTHLAVNDSVVKLRHAREQTPSLTVSVTTHIYRSLGVQRDWTCRLYIYSAETADIWLCYAYSAYNV